MGAEGYETSTCGQTENKTLPCRSDQVTTRRQFSSPDRIFLKEEYVVIPRQSVSSLISHISVSVSRTSLVFRDPCTRRVPHFGGSSDFGVFAVY